LDWAILEECVLLLGEYSFSVRQVAQYGLSDEDLALLEVSFKGIKLELVPLVSSRFREQHHHEGSDQIYDLPDLLKIFQSSRATDIRNKIFALLGVACTTHGLRADYGKSLRELYVDATRSFILNSGLRVIGDWPMINNWDSLKLLLT
jgi:hypothetical protein